MFYTTFYKILNAIGDIILCERTCCDKVLSVVDTILFKRQVGDVKNKHAIFVRNRVVKDASCYIRNEQLNPSWFIHFFQIEVL